MVNAWVRKKTAGKIDSIVGHLDPTTEKLNRSIESTLQKDEFSWRLP